MKLWFEGWNVNADDAFAVPVRDLLVDVVTPATRYTVAINSRDNSLAVNRRRGDSAVNDFVQEM